MEFDEIETFQQQALEITPFGADFDPSKQPQNGEEYLMHMLYERKQCPIIVVKRPKILKSCIKDTSPLQELELSCSAHLPDANLLPTTEWKDLQASNFIRTRSKIMMLRHHLTNYNYTSSLEPPMITDDVAWLKFCQQHQPLLSLILRFEQRVLEQLLVMIGDWLKGETNDSLSNTLNAQGGSSSTSVANSVMILDLGSSDQWLGDWLYGVLACLHLPLEPDVHSTLRDIARTCMQFRNRLQSDEFEKAIPYNLFIYIIGKIFDQLDLLEFV